MTTNNPVYNTGSRLSRIKVTMSAELLQDLDQYGNTLAKELGQPSVSRSLALSRLMTKAKQQGVMDV